MAITQPQRWIIDWLLHNSMLHCKNSRPEIFQAFPLFIKNEVKWGSFYQPWKNNMTHNGQSIMNPSRSLSLFSQTCARSGVKEAVTSRPLYPSNDSIVPLFPPLTAVKDPLHSPPMSLWDVGRSLLLLRYSVYFSIWCLFLHRHQREEAPQLHVSYHCTFCNKFNSVQIWPWGTKTLNTKCAL